MSKPTTPAPKAPTPAEAHASLLASLPPIAPITDEQYINYAILHMDAVQLKKPQQTPVASTGAPGTKKQRTIDMLGRPQGATVLQIAEALGISKIAARSLIGDVRNAKIRVTQDAGVYKLA